MLIEIPDNPNWDEYFVAMARLASSRSKDPNTKIGSVIVGPHNEVVSTGYNSFPRGLVDDVPARLERPEKYKWFEHAERNSLYHAALRGSSTAGCKMYLSCWVPCTDCARGIINSGIIEVILGQRNEDASRVKWIEEAKCSAVMFKEAKVKVRYYEDEVEYTIND